MEGHEPGLNRIIPPTGKFHTGIKHQQRNTHVPCGGCVAEVSTYGGGITYLVTGELVSRLNQHRRKLLDHVALHDVRYGCQRANPDPVVHYTHARQSLYTAQVHQGCGILPETGIGLRGQVGAPTHYGHTAGGQCPDSLIKSPGR